MYILFENTIIVTTITHSLPYPSPNDLLMTPSGRKPHENLETIIGKPLESRQGANHGDPDW